jgi:fructosamine-3-kinase
MNNMNYGFQFTEIIIINDLFIKKSKNKEGSIRLQNEVKLYLELKKINIDLSMPELIYYNKNEIHIEYIKDSILLTHIINKDNWKLYVSNILKELIKIHTILIEKNMYDILNDIDIETHDKILKRYNENKWNECIFLKKIKYVNNVKIKNIEYYVNLINKRVKDIIIEKKINTYSLIHGDLHLGNILLRNNILYFIDPRGYFGNTEIYGLKEYDYAKLLFGISGYSIFDTMKIDNLEIDNENINIDFIKKYEYIFSEKYFDELTILFTMSIWLGNNSCFIDVNKKVISLMIAYYYCEKYLNNY